MVDWIVSSSVLIVIVALLRYLLKGKISLRLQYALWVLVLVRLLVPFSFGQSSFSMMNAVTVEQTEYYVWYTGDMGSVQAEPAAGEQAALPAADAAAPGISVGPNTGEVPVNTMGIQLDRILQSIWIAGIAVTAVLFLFSNLHFAVRLRRSRQRVEQELTALPVYVSGIVETPCLFGLFRPAIYVTQEVLNDETSLRHVLAHETTHERHWDNLWALLRCACLALHWYNPLVWWAASLSRRDGELACDEDTIRFMRENERFDYGRTLIGLTCTKRGALLTTATTMTGSKRSLKERITLIAKAPKTAAYMLIAVLLIAVVAVSCTFTGAAGDTPWRWAKKLSAEEIDNASIWGYNVEYDLSDAETEEVLRAINGLNRFDFTQNSRLEGPTPESGLILVCGEDRYYINQAGYLEMKYGGKQWWIKDDKLDTMITSLLESYPAQDTVNARGWLQSTDNRRINVYANHDAKLLVDGVVISEAGEDLYSEYDSRIGTVWLLGDSGRKMYALYNGSYEIIADGDVKIEYVDSGYFDKVVEYTAGNALAAFHISDYSLMEINCEAIRTDQASDTIAIQPSHVYTELELNALNED